MSVTDIKTAIVYLIQNNQVSEHLVNYFVRVLAETNERSVTFWEGLLEDIKANIVCQPYSERRPTMKAKKVTRLNVVRIQGDKTRGWCSVAVTCVYAGKKYGFYYPKKLRADKARQLIDKIKKHKSINPMSWTYVGVIV